LNSAKAIILRAGQRRRYFPNGSKIKISTLAGGENSHQEIVAENSEVLLPGSVAVAVLNDAAAGGVVGEECKGSEVHYGESAQYGAHFKPLTSLRPIGRAAMRA
jgi:hypothetical protein